MALRLLSHWSLTLSPGDFLDSPLPEGEPSAMPAYPPTIYPLCTQAGLGPFMKRDVEKGYQGKTGRWEGANRAGEGG